MKTTGNEVSAVAVSDLPEVITRYLVARGQHDLETTGVIFAANAAVTDEGHTYHGRDEIRDWLGRSGSAYTYTTTLVAATKVDDAHFTVVQHLAGDFPGGVVDLQFRFTLRGQEIAELVIEP
jgi:hypothetical protein